MGTVGATKAMRATFARSRKLSITPGRCMGGSVGLRLKWTSLVDNWVKSKPLSSRAGVRLPPVDSIRTQLHCYV